MFGSFYNMNNLKEKTAKGLFWGFVNNGSTQLLNLVIGIFMARLLTPADYGIVGVLAIFSALASALQTSGFSQALVNIKTPTDKDYNSVFWFNISVSITLYVLLFFSAPLIAKFFHQDCLVPVSRVLFLTLPVYAAGVSSQAYLIKNMLNREIAIIAVISLIVSGTIGITMALNDFSYWSLVAQQLSSALIVVTGRYLFIPWRPRIKIDFGPVKKMFGFSVKLLVTNIVNIINFHILTVVFGRLLPIQEVGYYSQANKWNNLAKTTIADAVGQVSQTVLVSVSDEQEREVRVFRKMMRFTAFLSFPALLGLALVSREFILLTIGDKWEPSIPLLQILCIGGAFMPFYMLYQNLTISAGRSDIYMWCQLGQMLIQLVLVLVLYPYGITAIVWGYTLLTIVWVGVWQMVARHLLGVRFTDAFADFGPFLMVTVVVLGATWLLTGWMSSVCLPQHLQLALMLFARIVVAVALYVGAMKMLHATVMEECLHFLLRKKA